jgi:heme exporter protein B
MDFWRQTLTILQKDLRSELRSKEAINASLSFSLVILLLFSFAFPDEVPTDISGGLLWMVFAFAGALILNRSFARELPNDCLDALIASPAPGSALFLGKALANVLLLLAVEAVCFPVFGVFYNVRWARQFWPLVLVVLLGTWGITVIGTMFSALTVNLRLREVMLPLLVYPTLIPCLVAAMQVSTQLIAGDPLDSDSIVWTKFLIGFDVIFTSLALVLVEIILVG